MGKEQILYKLTNGRNETHASSYTRLPQRTRGGRCKVKREVTTLKWGKNVTHKAKGRGKRLCSNGVIHAYIDPFMAVLHDGLHGNYIDNSKARLWISKGKVIVSDKRKEGVKELTTIKRVPLPKISEKKKLEFCLRCIKGSIKNRVIIRWCDRYMSGHIPTRKEILAIRRMPRDVRAIVIALIFGGRSLECILYDVVDMVLFKRGKKVLLKCIRDTFGLPKKYLI